MEIRHGLSLREEWCQRSEVRKTLVHSRISKEEQKSEMSAVAHTPEHGDGPLGGDFTSSCEALRADR